MSDTGAELNPDAELETGEHPEDQEAEEQLHALMIETSTPGELFDDLVNRTGVYRDAP